MLARGRGADEAGPRRLSGGATRPGVWATVGVIFLGVESGSLRPEVEGLVQVVLRPVGAVALAQALDVWRLQ
jgi:hypothetical protein